MRKILLSILVVTVTSACDSTRPGGPGTVTAVLVSPNGAEGAAVLDITGPVESLSANGDVSLYRTPSANGTRAILARLTPGELSMKISLADVSATPQIGVVEVAGGDDKLRSSLAGYRVELR